jgi:hypothetical protein
LAAALLQPAAGARAGSRAPLTWRLDVTTGAGWTSNAYEVERDARDGLFVPLELELELGRRVRRDFRWNVELDLERPSFLDAELRQAEETEASVAGRWRWTVRRGSHAPARIELKAAASADRSRLTSRFDPGEELVSHDHDLSHRYDANQLRVDLDVSWRPRGRWRWGVEAMARRRDYVEDYEDEPAVDSLDFTEAEVSGWAEWRPIRSFELKTELGVGRRAYDERFVRNAAGSVDPKSATRYAFTTAGLDLRWRASERWRTWMSVSRESRADGRSGWDDRRRDRALVRWYFEPTDGVELRLTGRWDRKRYPWSHVGNDLDRPLRRVDARATDLAVELELAPSWTLEAGIGIESEDSRTPGYSFEQGTCAVSVTRRFEGRVGRSRR